MSKLVRNLSVFGVFMLFTSNSWAADCRVDGVTFAENRVEVHCLRDARYAIDLKRYPEFAKYAVKLAQEAQKKKQKLYIESTTSGRPHGCAQASNCRRLTLISTNFKRRLKDTKTRRPKTIAKPKQRGSSAKVDHAPRNR